jgi:drug/metabolite transporter (DMT)-like permease
MRQPSRLLGIVLVVLSAIFFAATPSLARVAYDAGSDPQTMALARFLCGALICGAAIAVRGGRLIPDRRTAWAALAIGAVYAVQSAAYLAAVRTIPVGVAVVVFYTFPGIAAVIGAATGLARLSPARIAGLAGAFAGVVLATGASASGLDPLGLALAALGAVGTAAFVVFGAVTSRRIGPLAFAFTSFAAAAIVFAPFVAVSGGLALPQTPAGWVALAAGSGLFVLAILATFTALGIIDTTLVTIVANLEPLFAIAFAFILLAERLAPLQMAGALLVIAAVTLPLLQEWRSRPPAPAQ